MRRKAALIVLLGLWTIYVLYGLVGEARPVFAYFHRAPYHLLVPLGLGVVAQLSPGRAAVILCVWAALTGFLLFTMCRALKKHDPAREYVFEQSERDAFLFWFLLLNAAVLAGENRAGPVIYEFRFAAWLAHNSGKVTLLLYFFFASYVLLFAWVYDHVRHWHRSYRRKTRKDQSSDAAST